MARYKIRIFGNDVPVFETAEPDQSEADTMTDHMRQGNSHEGPPSPFEGTPFSCIERLDRFQSRDAIEDVIQEANRVYSKLETDGEIQRDEFVTQAISYPDSIMSRESYYYRFVGPTAVTADEVRWNRTWQFNPEEYPDDEEKRSEALSELNIPDDSMHKYVPTAVIGSCSALKAAYEQAERGVTIREMGTAYQLDNSGIAFKADDRIANQIQPYLKELPWIEPPDRSKPAWEWVGDESADTAETATEGGEADA